MLRTTHTAHSRHVNHVITLPSACLHLNSRWRPFRATSKAASAHAPCLLFDLHDTLVPYEQAWTWQRQRVDEACASDSVPDCLAILQHPPSYTLGAGSSEAHLRFDPNSPPHPLYRTERGGEVTYHGPGQLVLYPILNLRRHTPDLHAYLRSLEEVVIRALHTVSGLEGERVDGMTGVWVQGAKLAAVGVRARKWITYHGVALNVTADLTPFQHIVPCGISDKPVGSVLRLMGGSGGSPLLSVQADAQLLTEYRYALLEAFEEVFGLDLQPALPEMLQMLACPGPAA